MDILPDGDLKDIGVGHPYVPKDESEGREINLAEQRDSFLLSSRERVYNLWEKRQETQEDYKVFIRLRREKIRTKAN